MSKRRDAILAAASDAGAEFVYYGRKEDEELSQDDIREAVASGEVTLSDIVKAFLEKVQEGL